MISGMVSLLYSLGWVLYNGLNCILALGLILRCCDRTGNPNLRISYPLHARLLLPAAFQCAINLCLPSRFKTFPLIGARALAKAWSGILAAWGISLADIIAFCQMRIYVAVQ